MPALDIDRAYKLALTQHADHVGPIGVAESWRSMVDVISTAPDACRAHHVPVYAGILAMDVKHLVHPGSKLRKRINQAHQLVARLPFQSQCRARQLAEHHLPGV